MGLFDDYRNSGFYRFVEKVANACTKLVNEIVDRLKGNR
jgi:hypothetical protein